jgi:catechol 2,3-dioxygenase-like lactoylglutathione lyase family enzyme
MSETTAPGPVQGLGNKAFVQVCLIVDDADEYARRYAEIFGVEIGEAHVTDGFSDTKATYFGAPTDAKARIYSWRFGDIGFELLQPLGPPSVWLDWLDAHGPSVHHIALAVTDSDGVARQFTERGYPVSQQGFDTGRLPNGGHTGMYTYLETQKALGTTIELLESFDPNGKVR